MDLNLNDKTIFMTGALGGIAEAVVRTLLDAGAFMVLTDALPPEKATPLLDERGYDASRFTYLQMDVTDHATVDQVVDAAFARHPGINTVLGHAGGTGTQYFRDSTAEAFDKILAFNLHGQVYLTRAILRHWTASKCKGHLIYTSTWVNRIPWQGISAYIAAKAGLDMFAKTMALEYAKDGIRFNLLAPGNVAAGASKAAYDTEEPYRKAVDAVSPHGRNTPEAIANGFLYLCSHLADEVVGNILNVDAGVGLPRLQQNL